MDKFKPKKPEKDVISVRIPNEILEQLDAKATEYNISRNEFINQCITFALSKMEDHK